MTFSRAKAIRALYRIRGATRPQVGIIVALATTGAILLYPSRIQSDLTLGIVLQILGSAFSAVMLIGFLCSWFIIGFLKNSGVPKISLNKLKRGNISELTLSHITRDRDSIFMLIKPRGYKNRFSLASTKKLARISGTLNHELFKETPWEDTLENKTNRNIAHSLKNNKTITLISDEEGNYIGFTHILPVSLFTWNSYINGDISDLDFSDSFITSENNEYRDESAYGIILFSIGIVKHARKSDNEHLQLLFLAIAFHLHQLAKSCFKDCKFMNVLIQPADKSLERLCINNGLKQAKATAKDGGPIYTGQIDVGPGFS